EHHPRGSQLPIAARQGTRDDSRTYRNHQSLAARHRLQSRALHTIGSHFEYRPGDPRFSGGAAGVHRRVAGGFRRGGIFGREIPPGEAHHRALSRARGHRRARQALDRQGDRRAPLVHLFGLRAVAGGRARIRALRRFRGQERRPEREARLHRAGRQPGVPVRPGDGRAAHPLLPLRGDRRSLRQGERRIRALRFGTLRAAGFAAPHRDAATENPHHRAVHCRGGVRAQRERADFDVAQPDHRGVSRRTRGSRHMSAKEWTTPADLRRQVQRYWDSGSLLAAGVAFPLELRLKGPDTRALSDRFDEVRHWIRELERESRYAIEWREVNHRLLGRNRVPARIVVPGEREAFELIGRTDDAARFRSLAAATAEKLPELGAWLAERPLVALQNAADWDRILAVLLWFRQRPRSGLYLRQLDIAGVDTKFIETRKPLLSELLDVVLKPETDNRNFEQRYGLASKPSQIRFRILDERLAIQGVTDLAVPAREFACLDLPVERVFITENEINGLVFPAVPSGIVIFGLGYGLERLSEVRWLHERALHYWGDIDTY